MAGEAMDKELVEAGVPTVGERLRAAREEKGLKLEDIAAQTRIPQRHLESIETSDWDKLPAPTYTVGFAKSFASAVGLDRSEIGDQLREEMGGQRFTSSEAQVFEPADPARTMPKWLVIGTIVAVLILIALMSWLNNRALQQPGPAANAPSAATTAPAAAPAANAPRATPQAPVGQAQGPVVLTATGPAWIQVTDQGKTLFSGQLSPGQTFTVPPTATAPMLKAGKPEALQVTVGGASAPPVGPAGKVASNVSLKPADLMRGGPQQPAPAAVAAAPATNAVAQ